MTIRTTRTGQPHCIGGSSRQPDATGRTTLEAPLAINSGSPQLAIAAVIMAILALFAGTVYGLATGLGASVAVRQLLLAAAVVLAILAGSAGLRSWHSRWIAAGQLRQLALIHADLAALRTIVSEVRDPLAARLAVVEQRLEELDEEYERGWVHGAAQTADALSNQSTVRTLRPNSRLPHQ